MASKEISSGEEKKDSIWNSRFFRIGGAVAVVGAGIGIGIIAWLGLGGVAIGAGHYALRGNRSK
ncbi:MAG: hypothetical protein AAB512_04685 [Patescibacteria group bacterium]